MKTIFLIVAFVAFAYGDSIEQVTEEESMARLKWFDKIKDGMHKINKGIHNVVDKTKHDIHNVVDKTKHDIHNVVDKTKHDVHNVVDKTKHDIHNVVDKTKHDVHNVVDKTKHDIHNVVDKTKHDVHNAVDKTKEGIHKIEKGLQEKERMLVQKVRQAAKKLIAILKKNLSAHCENTTCTLCANVYQGHNGCVDVAVDLSDVSVTIDLKIDNNTVIAKKFAADSQPLCVPVVLSVEGCLQPYDLSITKDGFHVCLRIAAEVFRQEVISYDVKCITLHGKKFEVEDAHKEEKTSEEEETSPTTGEIDQSAANKSGEQTTE